MSRKAKTIYQVLDRKDGSITEFKDLSEALRFKNQSPYRIFKND